MKRDAAQEIAHIMSGAVPIAGTPAERYLTSRGLAVPEGADLSFHPDLTHWDQKAGFPGHDWHCAGSGRLGLLVSTALISRNRIDGAVGKAAIAKPRMMLGRVAGGAVRLAPLRGN